MLIDGKPVEVLETPYREVAYLRAENERLKAELAEAKNDAERYRWLIKNAVREKILVTDTLSSIVTLKIGTTSPKLSTPQ